MKTKIKFKLTTQKKLPCSICNNPINGKEGYVELRRKYDTGYINNIKINICNDCFSDFLNEYVRGRKDRVENYKILLRKRILRGLK